MDTLDDGDAPYESDEVAEAGIDMLADGDAPVESDEVADARTDMLADGDAPIDSDEVASIAGSVRDRAGLSPEGAAVSLAFLPIQRTITDK